MKKKPKPRREKFACPHCGADVPLGAAACKECGSDADTGWQSGEEIGYQQIDLPTGYSQHDDHPGQPLSTRRSIGFYVVLLVAVLAMVLFAILG